MLTRIVPTLMRVRRSVRINHRKDLRKRSAYTLFCLRNFDFNFSSVFIFNKKFALVFSKTISNNSCVFGVKRDDFFTLLS
jgi:hypothetical protein